MKFINRSRAVKWLALLLLVFVCAEKLDAERGFIH